MKRITLFVLLFCTTFSIFADQTIKLASTPALSPDGEELTFMWKGELWQTKTDDGYAIPITFGSSINSSPFYSPDGKTIYFQSNKDEGGSQIYSMKSSGGSTTKITSDTQGYNLLDISSDGKYLLAGVHRNYTGVMGKRLVKITIDGSRRDQLIFDGYATNAKFSPDASKVIFTREGGVTVGPYRQGYRGSSAPQLWLYDIKTKAITKLKLERYGSRDPIWNPSGKSFYFTSEKDGCYNLYEYTLASKSERQLTFFKDAPVLIPTLSKNGKTLVFRQLFDFYQIDPTASKSAPSKIKLVANSFLKDNTSRRYLNEVVNGHYTGDLDFTDDGLEVAMAIGGSLYVMDSVMCKPVKVDGNSGSQITELVFSKDFKTIYYLKDVGTAVNLWKAEVEDPSKFWWQNTAFKTTQITQVRKDLSNLELSPDGKKISYQKGRGTLAVCDLDGSNEKIIKQTPYPISYIWAPDSVHMIASFGTSDRVRNVWIVTVDGSSAPYSISRTPGWSGFGTWSPDGKTITYFNRRSDGAFFLHWLTLDKELDEQTALDLKKKKALNKMDSRPKVVDAKKDEKV
ncbi:MAG: PD40 domain-containing protein, partial [Lentisphaeria bacterium]|nr:PD40 domain-containing protein [Lentisphaeria bacterium]